MKKTPFPTPPPHGNPEHAKPGIRNYRQLAHAMLLTLEKLGDDQMARVDARLWFTNYQRIIERLDKEALGRRPGKG